MKRTKYLWLMGGILCAVVIAFLSYTIYQTSLAHTTFERYYAFRGCVALIDKTDTYGDCRLANGQTIKMVLYNGRWYLDGDLPSPWGDFTF
jgi:hypothetical protein